MTAAEGPEPPSTPAMPDPAYQEGDFDDSPAPAEPVCDAPPAPESPAGASGAEPHGPPTYGPPSATPRRWPWFVRWPLGLLLIALFVLGGWEAYRWLTGEFTAKKALPPPPPVPVVTATATTGNLPIYMNGLGNVTALNTVTVHTRVDGQINAVNYVEGQIVHDGDVLVEIDPRPFQVLLTQARGQKARDEASLGIAKLDLARYEEAGMAASRQQLETAAAAVGQFEGAVITDQGQIDSANLQLAYCRVTAPLTGQVGLRLVDAGNIVHQSDPGGLVVITQIEPITVIFTLAQDDLPQVLRTEDGGVGLAVEAFNRDLSRRLATGKLTAIDNQIDPTTGTVRLRATFDNKDHALFPNQFVNARLLVNTLRGVILVPAAAVQRSPQGLFVYIVKSDNTVEMRPIKTAATEGDTTAVTEGIAEGETVVTEGVDKLKPGTKVAMRPAAGTAEATPSGTAGAAPTKSPGAAPAKTRGATPTKTPDAAPSKTPEAVLTEAPAAAPSTEMDASDRVPRLRCLQPCRTEENTAANSAAVAPSGAAVAMKATATARFLDSLRSLGMTVSCGVPQEAS